jgi:eukaryotic-like serine/threonine-protein kinase
MLGRYALYEKIASGGMASVHLGRLFGPSGFARTVAIKRMHPHLAEDPEFSAMFLDEARLAARIRHPNVVPTLDVVAAEGELFLVMEFVQGESLSRLIKSAIARGEKIAPETATTLMAGVLHGLHAAHEATSDRGTPLEIVHRDVSPHNILVGVDGAPRLLDFGVAKAMGRIHSTREGQLKGKLSYMAPEQLRGKVSRRTDIYAASIVLWETITLERLFPAEDEAELFELVLRGTDVPPSAHRPGISKALDDVVLRGLSVDPQRRFATAREMARALEDAIGLVAPSKIGEWVEAMAHDTIAARGERLASIENDSLVRSVPSQSSSIALVADAERHASAPLVEATSTQMSTGSASSPGRAHSRMRRSSSWLGVALGAVLLLATAWFSLQRGAFRSSLVPTPESMVSGPSSPKETLAAAATGSRRDDEGSAASDAAAASIVPLIHSAAASTSASSARPARSNRSVTKSPAGAPCQLVKSVDKFGEPHFSCPCASCP